MIQKKCNLLLCGSLIMAGFATFPITSANAADTQKDLALERARKTVTLLNDIYVNVVVLITKAYVEDEDSYPAGRAAKLLFKAVKKAGHPETRIIDTSGKPYSSTNVAKDPFEKEAITKLLAGAGRYEKVEINGGNRMLRAATAVPIVSPKCVICHPNYSEIEKGKPVGALVYSVPIDKDN
jgi:hypothetical protein